MDSLEAVQSTNDDASECKRCAVDLNYWKDKYIHFFVRHYERKTPEINRGYFARVCGVNAVVKSFLDKTGNKCQIINLGCGFDTLYWRLKENNFNISNFIDVDFPTVTARKCHSIKRNNVLLQSLHNEDGEISFRDTDLHSFNYHITGVDLRNINDLEYKLLQCGVDYNLPTLFISECVLIYIEPSYTQRLLMWITSNFKQALFVNYEQMNMNDRFSEVMIKNLRERGCALAGLEACKTKETQKQRFLNCGWSGCRVWDMMQIYMSIPGAERQRIEALEFLDEQELLFQLLQHYAISVAWKGDLLKDVDIT
ncbi:hypothetical protein V9T40_012581 [Parthenolecanium corni]|uniref:Leucine carboxyl methyltransferase 1 n=1 Tax=Parthenolecanium corni TaxID=536013 RepID=A0AAN9T9T0_9HEMI